MTATAKIQEFIEKAKASGASEAALIAMLTARGWGEKEVHEALASYYERITGMEIPSRQGTGTAAKDAFFHLLIFSTLATWTLGLGALAFTLIDKWLADNLFSTFYDQGSDIYSAAESIASILVAFPIYLLFSRAVLRDEHGHPEKLHSSVRKWLTYMALVVAAGIFIGDLIAALTYLLRGELTSRFIAKALVVLVLSGGVFFYYFGGLRRSELATLSRWNRDRWMAAVSTATVVLMLILGFAYVGAPSTQRALRADQRRVQDLFQISNEIHNLWTASAKLPAHLDELHNTALADPLTRIAYEYQFKTGSQYELCATFAAASEPNQNMQRPGTWSHPQGPHCFALDAAQTPDNPGYFPQW